MLKGKGRDYVIINVGGTCHRITHRTPTGGAASPPRGGGFRVCIALF